MKRDRERRWIEWIARLDGRLDSGRFPLGIGDDAALWRPGPGHDAVLSVDSQSEGTHFDRSWIDLRDAGARAVSSSVSDLAAMGARGGALLVSILSPRDFADADFRRLYRGIHAAARGYGVPIVGGNISRGPLSVTVTALGEVERGKALTRSGARPGDEIWVSGSPGLARLGLLAIQRGKGGGKSTSLRSAVAALRRPRARLDEARHLARAWPVTAMIDLSDGLASDLERILDASSAARGSPLGATLDESALSALAVLVAAARELGESPIDSALAGGEDYELLFTTRPRAGVARRLRDFSRRHDTGLTRIGAIDAEAGIRLRRAGGRVERVRRSAGFEHFAR